MQPVAAVSALELFEREESASVKKEVIDFAGLSFNSALSNSAIVEVAKILWNRFQYQMWNPGFTVMKIQIQLAAREIQPICQACKALLTDDVALKESTALAILYTVNSFAQEVTRSKSHEMVLNEMQMNFLIGSINTAIWYSRKESQNENMEESSSNERQLPADAARGPASNGTPHEDAFMTDPVVTFHEEVNDRKSSDERPTPPGTVPSSPQEDVTTLKPDQVRKQDAALNEAVQTPGSKQVTGAPALASNNAICDCQCRVC